MSSRPSGTLWLVPNTLDLGATDAPAIEQVLPHGVLHLAARLTHWVAEDAKTTRTFLKRVQAVAPLARALQDVHIAQMPRAPKGRPAGLPDAAWATLLAPALAGEDMGLISEAGLPAVADPGSALVAAAHRAGVAVVPLPGPNALTMALAASGLNGQCFAFVGYLPTDAAARTARIRALDAISRRDRQTQIAIETPYRNAALMQALVGALAPETRLAVACGLTLPGGWCMQRTVAEWRRSLPAFEPKPHPSVFLWLAD
jgi:16S rRNA (cytidine1402-2'-O)-methyltransferase